MTMPLPTTMPAPVPTGPAETPSGGSARAGRAVPSAPDAPASGGGEFDDAVAAALLAVLGGALPTVAGVATATSADGAPASVTRGRMTATPATTGPLPGPATGTPTTVPTTTLPTTATATPTPAAPAGATGPAPTPPVTGTSTSATTPTPATATPQPAPAPAVPAVPAATPHAPPTPAATPNANAAQPVPIDPQPAVVSHRSQPTLADDTGRQTGPNGTLAVVPAQAPAAGQPTGAAAATGPTATPAAIPAPPHEQIAHVLGPLRHAPDGSYNLTVHLHPADLGNVDVSVSLRDGTVTMQLHADDAAARDLLRDSLGELRRELENAGLRAGELGVGAGSAGDRRGSDQRDGPDGGTRAIRIGPTAPAGGVPTDTAALRTRPLRPRSDLLDVHL